MTDILNRNDFFKQMERLQQVYSPLTDIALEEYYMALRFCDLDEIKEAFDYFCRDENYRGEFTPKPPQIIGVINEIRRNKPYQLPEDDVPAPVCRECNGTGFETWTGIDGRFKAKPCGSCEKGRRTAMGWAVHFKKKRKQELITDDKSDKKYNEALDQAFGEEKSWK